MSSIRDAILTPCATSAAHDTRIVPGIERAEGVRQSSSRAGFADPGLCGEAGERAVVNDDSLQHGGAVRSDCRDRPLGRTAGNQVPVMHRHRADDVRAARYGERSGRQGRQGPFDRIAEADGGGELTLGDDAAAEQAQQVVTPVNPRWWWWRLVRLNFRPRSRLHAGWQFGSAIAGADNTRAE